MSRKEAAGKAANHLVEAEAILAEIISSYGAGKVSSADPVSGIRNTLKKLQEVRKAVLRVK